VTLSAQARDNSGSVRLEISTDGQLRCSGGSAVSCNWNVRKVEPRDYTVSFEASDAAGNTATQTVTITVTGGNTKGGGKDSGGDSDPGTKGKGRKK
jgi:hypothetical protein